MKTAKQRRRSIRQRAVGIAQAIRTADFPEAVNIVAGIIGSRDGHRRRRKELERRTPLRSPGMVVCGDKGPEQFVRLQISDRDAAFIEQRRIQVENVVRRSICDQRHGGTPCADRNCHVRFIDEEEPTR